MSHDPTVAKGETPPAMQLSVLQALVLVQASALNMRTTINEEKILRHAESLLLAAGQALLEEFSYLADT